MNTVKIVSLALVSTFVLFSCKNEEKSNLETNLENELALDETTSVKEPIFTETYLYVTASSGLSLREYANLQSEKLAVMPYGTRVKVISAEKNKTMKVGELKGGMNEIEYNQKKGFAFNGFLSKYFPPEKGISAKRYAEDLKTVFPEVIFTETTGGTASKPTNSENLLLPNTTWNEAFYMAQQLFDFPKEFTFPSYKGKELQVIKEKKFQKETWQSELQVSRKNDTFSKIEYVYKNKGFSKKVTITKEKKGIKISKTELVM